MSAAARKAPPDLRALPVLYEDAQLAVVDKPAGFSSEGDVPAALRLRWGASAYVGLVHRLDTPTSGLLVCARTPAAAAALSRQLAQTADWYAAPASDVPGAQPPFLKRYHALLEPEAADTLAPYGVLRDYLFKDSRTGRVYPVQRPRKGVREAVLEYALREQTPSCARLEVIPHTGRTHQIRVQFASRKCPLLGDGLYGSRRKGPLGLRCIGLAFTHPESGERMEFEVISNSEE